MNGYGIFFGWLINGEEVSENANKTGQNRVGTDKFMCKRPTNDYICIHAIYLTNNDSRLNKCIFDFIFHPIFHLPSLARIE